jgi:hypothetical protein
MKTANLRVLCLTEETQDGKWWVAQCLDYDIAAPGKTIRDALYEFQRLVVARVAISARNGLDDPFAGLKRAPERYWKMFDEQSAPLKDEIPTFRLPSDEPPPVVPMEARVA